MTDRYAPTRDNLHTAVREIHRAWLLTARIPVSAWHHWRAKRHQTLADHHSAAAKRNSQKALNLAAKYPSLYWKTKK